MIHLSELLFLGGFLVFIVAILVVDMLVIDRKAHAVSIKEAGTWTAVWITLALAFSAFLWFHGDMVHGIHNFADLQAVAGKYAAHINLDPNDFEGSLQKYRHYMTVSYISGYLIEKALSVDNLFVMMMMCDLRLAANSDCGGIGFRLLAYDFLQGALLAKCVTVDIQISSSSFSPQSKGESFQSLSTVTP